MVDGGRSTDRTQPRIAAPTGFYITANHYGLTSRPFRRRSSRAMTVQKVRAPAGRIGVELHYPKPVVHEDVGEPPPDSNASLTARPGKVKGGGTVTFVVGGHRRTVKAGPGGVFTTRAAPGAKVRIPAGAARDRFGNHNGRAFG